jgi:DNA-binding NarL/FixJ family response regulator
LTTDTNPRKPRVLIADDEFLLRYTLKLIVEEHYEIVGEAPDGYVAVEMAEQLRPDVVLLDVSMPRMGGLEAAQRIRAGVPEVRIIIVSNHSSSVYMEEALNRGAHGYVVKSSAVLQLPEAIAEVLKGGIFRPA